MLTLNIIRMLKGNGNVSRLELCWQRWTRPGNEMILINNHGLEYLHVNIKSQLKRSKEIARGAMFADSSFVNCGPQWTRPGNEMMRTSHREEINHGLKNFHVNIKSQLIKRSKKIARGAMFAGSSFVGRGGQGLAKFQAQLSAITGQPLLSLLSKVVPKIHLGVQKSKIQTCGVFLI